MHEVGAPLSGVPLYFIAAHEAGETGLIIETGLK